MKHYILMCDIIDSGKKQQSDLMEDFKACTSYINKKYKRKITSPLTITLGDEFQGLIADLESAVKIIISLEEFIIENNFSLKLRHVLFYGEIETNINTTRAFEMLGKGLTEARKTLINLKSTNTRFYIDIANKQKNSIFNNSFEIFQYIVDKWKLESDHQLIHSFIKKQDYKLVSEELNKNRSLVWKREKTLNMSSYFSIKEIIYVTASL